MKFSIGLIFLGFAIVFCFAAPIQEISASNQSSIFHFSQILCDNEKTKDAYCYRMVSEPEESIMPARIPITSCLDSSQGSGGTVGVSFSVEIEIAANPTFSMASPILDLISLSTSFSVSKTFSLTSSYQCTVKKGKKGQLYASPIIVDAVFQKKALSQENDDSDWSAPFKVSVPVVSTPFFSCVTRYTEESCEVPSKTITVPFGKMQS